VAGYCAALAARVEAALGDGRFAVVLGGDCSIMLGCLLGARRSGHGPLGLAYVDAHADFATPEESRTGSAASMCLALAIGRGEAPLARLAGSEPLVNARNVVAIGRRDAAEPGHGQAALAASAILDLPDAVLRHRGVADVAERTLRSLTPREASGEPGGFWIHLDADVIDPTVMPAVDSPEPGGPTIPDVVSLLTPLVRHPRALGLSLTIYDPALDPDHSCAARLVALLETLFTGAVSLDSRAG
jgi:arginase